MNAITYAYDQQVHVIIAKRQELARKAAQARLAEGETDARVSIIIRVRATLGRVLIAIGERMHPEARRTARFEPATIA